MNVTFLKILKINGTPAFFGKHFGGLAPNRLEYRRQPGALSKFDFIMYLRVRPLHELKYFAIILFIFNKGTMFLNTYSDDLVYNVIRKLRDNKFIDLFEVIGKCRRV